MSSWVSRKQTPSRIPQRHVLGLPKRMPTDLSPSASQETKVGRKSYSCSTLRWLPLGSRENYYGSRERNPPPAPRPLPRSNGWTSMSCPRPRLPPTNPPLKPAKVAVHLSLRAAFLLFMRYRYLCSKHGEFFSNELNAFSLRCFCGEIMRMDWEFGYPQSNSEKGESVV